VEGLGFDDKRPLFLNGPSPRIIPEGTQRELIAPPPAQDPGRVISYELVREKDTKVLTLQQIFTNGKRQTVSLEEALADGSGNLDILKRMHPNNWNEFCHAQERKNPKNQRKKRKKDDPDFIYGDFN
jgi:hypothetical protein